MYYYYIPNAFYACTTGDFTKKVLTATYALCYKDII